MCEGVEGGYMRDLHTAICYPRVPLGLLVVLEKKGTQVKK